MRHYPPSELPIPATDNLLAVVNGKPYIVGNYDDQDSLPMIERGLIQNSIIITTTDPHISIVDIVIDRIGTEPLGNEMRYRYFLETLARNSKKINGIVEVLRPDIEVVMEYELTNERDGTLVRRTTASIVITDKTTYLDEANPDLITGPILTNFIGSTVKTITDRAYGADRLILTLTKLTLSYRDVTSCKPCPSRRVDSPAADLNLSQLYGGISDRDDYLAAHHYESSQSERSCNGETPNNLYHFENCGKSIRLHRGEIDSPYNHINKITIGTYPMNKSFVVGGGHRIELRASIWTNDEIIIRDTSKVYRQLAGSHCHHPSYSSQPHHCHDHDCDPCDDRGLIRMIAEEHYRNDRQECDISYLNAQSDKYDDLIQALADRLDIEVAALKELIKSIVTNGGTTGQYPDAVSIVLTTEGKLALPEHAMGDANTGIKLTYNKFGVVVGSTALTPEDIPALSTAKIEGLDQKLAALDGKSAYVLPTANEVIKGGVTASANSHGLTLSPTGRFSLEVATPTSDGAMAYQDKATLDALVAKVADLERQQALIQP